MARAPKKFTIVRSVNGGLEISTYENAEAVRSALAHVEGVDGGAEGDGAPLAVFSGEPMPFTIKRTPTVTLGNPRGRKPRSSSGKPRARKPKATAVGEEFFSGEANGNGSATVGGSGATPTEG